MPDKVLNIPKPDVRSSWFILKLFSDKSEAMKREYWFKKTLRTRPKKESFLREKGIIIVEGQVTHL